LAVLDSILDVQFCLPGLPGSVMLEAIEFTATAMFNCRSVFVLGTPWRCHAPTASVPPGAISSAIRAA
jgi:hypothetical protein